MRNGKLQEARTGRAVLSALAMAAAAPGLREGALLVLQQGAFRPDLELDQQSGKARIRCPHCRWRPERSSRWFCLPCGAPEHFTGGCSSAWNTFDTRGRCPGCSYQWRHTSCLACGRWARHDDWYEPEPSAEGGGGGGAGGRRGPSR